MIVDSCACASTGAAASHIKITKTRVVKRAEERIERQIFTVPAIVEVTPMV
jgi:hypothetical protein